ncbi:MAG: ABC transporter ATP-binding protein [Actinobacteria bacterium]|nr:ABC transporter ATP-binding protein [Actinomycetota bacterium]
MDHPAAAGGRPVVTCEGLVKVFGDVRAVDDVTLAVHEGELLALLGPSGCGKTTFLRLVAGFERPDNGRIELAGTEVAGPGRHVPPERRHVGVVFQDYALFPHLNVAANVGYGVRDRSTRADRVQAVLDMVGLTAVADRYPHELSGGQQQRVALARALAPEPAIVLLDEPFSNLDAALRVEVRNEVRTILKRAGATAVLVTHDQEEALSLADRVAVMRAGRVLQVGTAQVIYERPADPFVAAFVGDADLLWGEVGHDGVATPIGILQTSAPLASHGTNGGERALVVVRAETVRLRLDGSGPAVVRRRTFYGHDQVIEVELDTGEVIRCRMGPGRAFEPGDRVRVSVTEPVVAFPASALA